jgi:hypothetical protein
MTDNPIVEEVHRIREQMLEEFGGDMDALVDEIQRREKESAAAGRKVVPMPPRIPAPTEPIKKVG